MNGHNLRHLTQTPGINENNSHMAPSLYDEGNTLSRPHVMYNYPAGYTGYFPNGEGLDVQPSVIYTTRIDFTITPPVTPTWQTDVMLTDGGSNSEYNHDGTTPECNKRNRRIFRRSGTSACTSCRSYGRKVHFACNPTSGILEGFPPGG